jgi:Fur family ferric uptake transcriptional regulator
MQRMTRQRTAVVEVLGTVTGFRSAQQLHDELRERGEAIGLATVYRTLQHLTDAGEVDVLRTAEGESLYRRCAQRSHHHHLVCRSCGAAVEIAADLVERWAHEVGAAHGFTDVEHVAELTGTCTACARSESASRAEHSASS